MQARFARVGQRLLCYVMLCSRGGCTAHLQLYSTRLALGLGLVWGVPRWRLGGGLHSTRTADVVFARGSTTWSTTPITHLYFAPPRHPPSTRLPRGADPVQRRPPRYRRAHLPTRRCSPTACPCTQTPALPRGVDPSASVGEQRASQQRAAISEASRQWRGLVRRSRDVERAGISSTCRHV
jgi:hypothetical protein